MNFLIADTFTDSLAKLAGDEQKAVKTTAFDLQMNPANPGLRFHKLERAKDPNFWSVSANMDIRLIVHRTDASLLLCYVDHHDQAYRWAERRKLQTHPKTGAAQLIEIRETVKEIINPVYVTEEVSKPAVFAGYSDEALLGYGIPEEWLADIRHANEDSILEMADHLPAEAAEAVLDLAVGVTPEPARVTHTDNPFEHPDAQRRFRILSNQEELERALDYPWEKWTVFLHPKQRQFAEQAYNGPARVSGSAGTGKTIVALHRAVNLARANEDARVLLTTFSDALANALHVKLKRLISHEPCLGERLEVHSIQAIARRLYERNFGVAALADTETLGELLRQATENTGAGRYSEKFLLEEWENIVDAWQLDDWGAYRDIKRLGRKSRLSESQRQVLWQVFTDAKSQLEERALLTGSAVFWRLADLLDTSKNKPFDFVVVDEAQDITPAQLRFVAALGGGKADGLFFAGDLGQRIFQQPFSWKSLGVDIRGRSRILKINYRTSHQIRAQADRLLSPEISDVDGNTESRSGTLSVFNGELPHIHTLDDEQEEREFVADWIRQQLTSGLAAHEIGLFVRSAGQLDRAVAAAKHAACAYKVLDERFELAHGSLTISTMHLAKGLEFRAVAVMACDDEVMPLQTRIEAIGDEADLEEVYNTERHLLYVACTRARDYLLVTAVDPASEFLDDLLEN